MNPVCAKCQAVFGVKKLGVAVIETTGTPPQAIKIWRADLLACPICNAEIVNNFGHEPQMERFENGFQNELKLVLEEKNRVVMYSPEHLVSVNAQLVSVRQNGKN